MLFGFHDSLKELKKILKDAGADMSLVRDWQKSFDKVKKQSPQLESQYTQVKKELETVYSILKEMEQLLISSKTDSMNAEVRKKITDFARKMKNSQGHFDHEFLISKDDSDFHLTYEAILSLCGKTLSEQKEVIILQSEVENLLAVTKEALEKEWPHFRAMAYFYMNRTDRELLDLPHQEKVEKVNRIYENEFLKPMREILADCIQRKPEGISSFIGKSIVSAEDSTDYILEEQIWN